MLRSLHAAGSPARDLDILAHVLDRLERERFTPRGSSHFVAASTRAACPRQPPLSDCIASLNYTTGSTTSSSRPLRAALLWGTHLAWAIEGWRRAHGSKFAPGCDTVGDFEALSSLSAYRYEHPDDVWPEIVEGPARFDGTGIGHPLIPP